MRKTLALSLTVLAAILVEPAGSLDFEEDTFATSAGDLTITFIGHGTLMLRLADKVIHVDPWSRLADYSQLPKADLVLLTHDHGDHLDPAALAAVKKSQTAIVLTAICAEKVTGGLVMANGDTKTVAGVAIEAVPAYNVVYMRGTSPYHPKGSGNGYILELGGKRVYIAGDTENTSEMKALRRIDIAFLPMNLPYTMTPEMVADAAKAFRPKVLYPYHFGDTDMGKLAELLRSEGDIDLRIRSME